MMMVLESVRDRFSNIASSTSNENGSHTAISTDAIDAVSKWYFGSRAQRSPIFKRLYIVNGYYKFLYTRHGYLLSIL